MTENATTGAAEADVQPTDPPPAGDDTTAALRREAAGYRRQLREAESERDGLRERVGRQLRADVERVAGDHLATPADLWLVESSPDSMLADDGNVDPAKVAARCAALVKERPGWGRRGPSFDGGPRGDPQLSGPTWAGLLSGGREPKGVE